jgi:hypothetical protein
MRVLVLRLQEREQDDKTLQDLRDENDALMQVRRRLTL